MSALGSLTDERDPAVAALRAAMDRFYESSEVYTAFAQPSAYPGPWAHILKEIRRVIETKGKCRVLEFGAGRSGFADFLGESRAQVELTAQDVTNKNRAFLEAKCDLIHIGSVLELASEYDVIFSTFVLEHISDPRRTLEKLFTMLTPGGVLLIFCPRYDFPFYLSHSADHYGNGGRVFLALLVLLRRVGSLLRRRPAFLIHTDPALLKMEWSMDRDAIHWVSQLDLRLLFAGRAKVSRLPIASGSLKDWIVKNLLQVSLAIAKPNSARQ